MMQVWVVMYNPALFTEDVREPPSLEKSLLKSGTALPTRNPSG